MSFQRLPQREQPASDAGLDGAKRLVELSGNFLMCPATEERQLQRVALRFRQCPQCHEWNTFVEERYATARDEEGSG